jgi:hypothetical protein
MVNIATRLRSGQPGFDSREEESFSKLNLYVSDDDVSQYTLDIVHRLEFFRIKHFRNWVCPHHHV